jgi:hypothetical protein
MFRAATIATVAGRSDGGAAGCLVTSVVRRGGGRTGAKVIGDGRIYLPPEFEKERSRRRAGNRSGASSPECAGPKSVIRHLLVGLSAHLFPRFGSSGEGAAQFAGTLTHYLLAALQRRCRPNERCTLRPQDLQAFFIFGGTSLNYRAHLCGQKIIEPTLDHQRLAARSTPVCAKGYTGGERCP